MLTVRELTKIYANRYDSQAASTVSIRPESIAVSDTNTGKTNSLCSTITAASFLGSAVRYDVMVGERSLRVVGPAKEMLPHNAAVQLTIPARSAVVVSRVPF